MDDPVSAGNSDDCGDSGDGVGKSGAVVSEGQDDDDSVM